MARTFKFNEYEEWSVEGDLFVLTNRKIRFTTLSSIDLFVPFDENKPCVLTIVKFGEEIKLYASRDDKKELRELGRTVAAAAGIEFGYKYETKPKPSEPLNNEEENTEVTFRAPGYDPWTIEKDIISFADRRMRLRFISSVTLYIPLNPTSPCVLILRKDYDKEVVQLYASRNDAETIMKLFEKLAADGVTVFSVEHEKIPTVNKDEVHSTSTVSKAKNDSIEDDSAEDASLGGGFLEVPEECTAEAPVTKKLRDMARFHERWAKNAYKWLMILAVIECAAAIIIGFIVMLDNSGDFLLFSWFLGGAVVWYFLNYLDARFARFVLMRRALMIEAKAEEVQKATETANIAYHIAANTIRR